MNTLITYLRSIPMKSVAGFLCGVATIAAILEQNGVSLGHIGTGTGVALIAALATGVAHLITPSAGVSK